MTVKTQRHTVKHRVHITLCEDHYAITKLILKLQLQGNVFKKMHVANVVYPHDILQNNY